MNKISKPKIWVNQVQELMEMNSHSPVASFCLNTEQNQMKSLWSGRDSYRNDTSREEQRMLGGKSGQKEEKEVAFSGQWSESWLI